MSEFSPPIPLSIAARRTWDRHAERIHAEGRWTAVDHDLLAVYCQTLEMYLRLKQDIDDHGTLVQGRTLQDKVRNPSMMGMANARADLIRLSKAVPLVNPKFDADGVEIDKFLEEIMANE